MKIIHCLIAFFLLPFVGYAQTSLYLKDLNGQPIKGNYSEVIGSPYLFDNWKLGSVVLENKQRYDSVLLKYDIVRDVLIFKKDNKQEINGFEFLSEPVEFKFIDLKNSFLSKYLLTKKDKSKGPSYLELIYSGKVSLFKKYGKRIVKKREYNSAVTEQHIEEFYTYLILDTRTAVIVEAKNLNDKIFAPFFSEKHDTVKNYTISNKLSFKKESDVVEILKYFNSKN